MVMRLFTVALNEADLETVENKNYLSILKSYSVFQVAFDGTCWDTDGIAICMYDENCPHGEAMLKVQLRPQDYEHLDKVTHIREKLADDTHIYDMFVSNIWYEVLGYEYGNIVCTCGMWDTAEEAIGKCILWNRKDKELTFKVSVVYLEHRA